MHKFEITAERVKDKNNKKIKSQGNEKKIIAIRRIRRVAVEF